jgi:crotonobetainyl-CoA:carnitine CoA-transferase CaiB-like acyl-CoA transferase
VAPRNSYQCGDGQWLSISASAQSIFERLMDAIGRPELRTDPRFAVNSARVTHVDELDRIIGAWIHQHDRDEALCLLEAAQVAAAPVHSIDEVFADPQFQARQSLVEVSDPTLGAIRLVNVVPRLSETPGEVRTTGPALGAHNAEVYGRLGLSVADQDALRTEGVI